MAIPLHGTSADSKNWKKILSILFEKDNTETRHDQRQNITTQQNEYSGKSRNELDQELSNKRSAHERLLQNAKKGDSGAIAALMNKTLRPKGVNVKAKFQEDTLQVLLDAERVLDKTSMIHFISHGIRKLNPENVSHVEVCCKHRNESVPAWSQYILLHVPQDMNVKGDEAIGRLSVSENQQIKIASGKASQPLKIKEVVTKKILIKEQSHSKVRVFGASTSQTSAPGKSLWVTVKNVSLPIMRKIWRWYISGFRSRPELPLYRSPRLWRVVLTFFVFSWVTAPFNSDEITTSSSSSRSDAVASAKNNSNSSIKASSKICVDNFNQLMSPVAFASIDKGTETMNITLNESLTKNDFERVSEEFSKAIFASCSNIFVQTVRVKSDAYVTTVRRP